MVNQPLYFGLEAMKFCYKMASGARRRRRLPAKARSLCSGGDFSAGRVTYLESVGARAGMTTKAVIESSNVCP